MVGDLSIYNLYREDCELRYWGKEGVRARGPFISLENYVWSNSSGDLEMLSVERQTPERLVIIQRMQVERRYRDWLSPSATPNRLEAALVLPRLTFAGTTESDRTSTPSWYCTNIFCSHVTCPERLARCFACLGGASFLAYFCCGAWYWRRLPVKSRPNLTITRLMTPRIDPGLGASVLDHQDTANAALACRIAPPVTGLGPYLLAGRLQNIADSGILGRMLRYEAYR
jgi:hypothetical protein